MLGTLLRTTEGDRPRAVTDRRTDYREINDRRRRNVSRKMLGGNKVLPGGVIQAGLLQGGERVRTGY